jgi:hypothetical protein
MDTNELITSRQGELQELYDRMTRRRSWCT